MNKTRSSRLEDLRCEGPFAPVFRDVRDPGRSVDWLGNPVREKSG